MNRNRQLSEKTYGKRHVQPCMPWGAATKKRDQIIPRTKKKVRTK